MPKTIKKGDRYITGGFPEYDEVILNHPQTLTEEQQAQARANIGVSAGGVTGAVLYDQPLSLTKGQKEQARTNIGAINQDNIDKALAAIIGGESIFDANWVNQGHFINRNGTVGNNSLFAISAPIFLKKGEKISVGSQGNTYCFIAKTDESATYYSSLVNASTSATGYNTYEYTATNDCYIALSAQVGRGDVVVKKTSLEKYLEKDAVDANSLGVAFDERTNLIDKTKLGSGYINANGDVINHATLLHTDYIPLEQGVEYFTRYILKGYYAFYDENFVKTQAWEISGNRANPFVCPAGSKYVRLTIKQLADIDNIWLSSVNIKPMDFSTKFVYANAKFSKNPCDYCGDEIQIFRKGICIGDSFTQGGFNAIGVNPDTEARDVFGDWSYPSKLARMTGMDILNLGYGGETMQSWERTHLNEIVGGYDFCIIFLGINDCANYGGITTESLVSLDNIIDKVKQTNNRIRIFVCTIPLSTYYTSDAIKQSAAIIKNHIASLDDGNIYIIDLAKYGHLDDSIAYESGHPTSYGYYIIAKDIKNYISWIVAKNPQDFRFVQFIGTDDDIQPNPNFIGYNGEIYQ